MANIIQQFKNANGDNIFPLAYAQGGMKMDLLWTNPNPTSSFTAQTISLDLSEYELFIISSKAYADSSSLDEINFSIAIKNTDSLAIAFRTSSPELFRVVTANDNGITFSTGKYTGDTNTSDSYAIPQKIYGIKMSYIVPTSVHGLQYVEV